MSRVRNVGFIVAANLMIGLYLASPGQAAPQGYVEVDAERVSQHIKEADTKRMSQQSDPADETKLAAQNANNPDLPKRVSVRRSTGWLQASSPTLNVSIPDTENRAVWLSRANSPQGANSLLSTYLIQKTLLMPKWQRMARSFTLNICRLRMLPSSPLRIRRAY